MSGVDVSKLQPPTERATLAAENGELPSQQNGSASRLLTLSRMGIGIVRKQQDWKFDRLNEMRGHRFLCFQLHRKEPWPMKWARLTNLRELRLAWRARLPSLSDAP